MKTKNDGGPAFPQTITFSPITNKSYTPQGDGLGGLSIRDWFAGMALQGFIASYAGPDCNSPTQEKAACASYSYADAMLKERDK